MKVKEKKMMEAKSGLYYSFIVIVTIVILSFSACNSQQNVVELQGMYDIVPKIGLAGQLPENSNVFKDSTWDNFFMWGDSIVAKPHPNKIEVKKSSISLLSGSIILDSDNYNFYRISDTLQYFITSSQDTLSVFKKGDYYCIEHHSYPRFVFIKKHNVVY